MTLQGASAMSTTLRIFPVKGSTLAWLSPRPKGKGEEPTSTCHSTPTVSSASATESTTRVNSGSAGAKGSWPKRAEDTKAGWNLITL
eukprot:CAMPEP_0172607280 /NCGR_PEP_ID=MMETSP1068-20121228/27482_1 /TAXON_ID=35684 /ORGANISM="Pseudopedinella elastica, Strain CCMP716" /LENGTH=86 /DNA_ID=CAMNT_0013410237 /DNA_START=360 /DNA_END=620 /DNA_ORIENTATION=+